MDALVRTDIDPQVQAQVQAMLGRSIQVYGGRERWERLRIVASLQTLGGLIPRMKGVGRTFPPFQRVELEPARSRAVFFDYPAPGSTGVFDAGRVSIGGAPLCPHRQTFYGLRRWRRWSPLDALYFFGYALTHYHSVPFILPDAQVRIRGWNPVGRALTVQFSPDVHTHCPVQTFYFDPAGLIVRHDYVADIVSVVARGAHFWGDYVTVDGFPFATHRRVYARLGRVVVPVVALNARLGMPTIRA